MIPTSNHNPSLWAIVFQLLYIFWFLHQTTTVEWFFECWMLLYIFWFLHQTTTLTYTALDSRSCISFDSYIKPQLFLDSLLLGFRCISFDSYIKPQLSCRQIMSWNVVYLLIPTSNHNFCVFYYIFVKLYIFWFLHQTTTDVILYISSLVLYIFWFLHQTTT